MPTSTDPLAGLRPLHSPPPVSWWPPAPGWWLLACLVLLAAGLIILHRRRTRIQRAALAELVLLATTESGQDERLRCLAALLKRYALYCYPTHGLAALTGEKWLHFLDAHGGNGEFINGCGRPLSNDLFRSGADANVDALASLTRQWIKTNRRRR